MAEVNTITYKNRYNSATTGLFKNNTTGDIGADDARDLVEYTADSFLNFLDDVLDEDAMTSNSATQVPTQQSVKAYTDTKWPLGGTADLSASVTIDGNDFDLIFGSPNSLDEFQVYANNSIYLELANSSMLIDDLLGGSITFSSESVFMEATDGVNVSRIDLDETSGINFESPIGFAMIVDDGIASAEWSLAVDHFHIGMSDTHIHADGTSIDIGMDDGVDSSSLTLTPTGGNVISDEFLISTVDTLTGVGVTGGNSAFISATDGLGGVAEINAFSDGTLEITSETLTHNGESLPLSTTVSISSAEFLALNTTPKTLIAAPGSGKFIQIISISASLDFISAAYATNVNVFFRYGAGGPAINSGSWNISQGADEYFRFGLTTDETGTAVASFVNQPIVAEAQTGDPTTGDGTGKVYITYRIVTL